MQICKVVFLIFTNFDISTGTKAGTKKQSLVSETLYINRVFAYFSIFQTLSGLFEYVKRVSHFLAMLFPLLKEGRIGPLQ